RVSAPLPMEEHNRTTVRFYQGITKGPGWRGLRGLLPRGVFRLKGGHELARLLLGGAPVLLRLAVARVVDANDPHFFFFGQNGSGSHGSSIQSTPCATALTTTTAGETGA